MYDPLYLFYTDLWCLCCTKGRKRERERERKTESREVRGRGRKRQRERGRKHEEKRRLAPGNGIVVFPLQMVITLKKWKKKSSRTKKCEVLF